MIDYIDYVADNMNPALNKEEQSPTNEKDKQTDTKRDERPQIGVTMRSVVDDAVTRNYHTFLNK